MTQDFLKDTCNIGIMTGSGGVSKEWRSALSPDLHGLPSRCAPTGGDGAGGELLLGHPHLWVA